MLQPACEIINLQVNKNAVAGKLNSNLTTAKTDYSNVEDAIKNFKQGDTISYNFISNQIQPYTRSFDNFLNDTYSKCNAQFSELDKNLEMVMDNVDENSVGLLISDYCFESKDGNWATAQSGITRLFTRRLNQNPDLTVAILKYNAGFNGRYYPGAINCNKSLPLYIWAFGTSQNIKKIVNLKVENEGVLVFQSSKQLQSKVIKVSGKPARGRVIRDGAIIVKEWDKEHYDDIYSLDLEMNVDCLALSKELIENVNTYKKAMLDANPELRSMYSEDDKIFYVFYLSNMAAEIHSSYDETETMLLGVSTTGETLQF